MTAWPEAFRCGGLLNGGMTHTQFARKEIYDKAKTQADYDANYEQTVKYINKYVADGDLPDQSALANNAVYIFGGGKDVFVPPVTTLEQKKYFESKGSKVSYNFDEDYGHYFRQDRAPMDIGKWCYE